MPKPAPMPMPMALTSHAAAPLLGKLGHAVGGLIHGEGLQSAQRADAAAGVDRLLHIVGGCDGIDDEIDQFQAVLGEIVGHLRLGARFNFLSFGLQIEHAQAERTE